eukprot:scaffold1136_cov260-Pinguiococcus_pyrenoidosus.AAC.19
MNAAVPNATYIRPVRTTLKPAFAVEATTNELRRGAKGTPSISSARHLKHARRALAHLMRKAKLNTQCTTKIRFTAALRWCAPNMVLLRRRAAPSAVFKEDPRRGSQV